MATLAILCYFNVIYEAINYYNLKILLNFIKIKGIQLFISSNAIISNIHSSICRTVIFKVMKIISTVKIIIILILLLEHIQ